jgi:uncharacterized membrane protein YbhN (UPF0104 family)
MIPQVGNAGSPATLRQRMGPWIGPLFAVAVMIAAFYLLRQELKHHSWREIRAAVANVPRSRIALAIGLTALNYIWLGSYDALALRYLGRRLVPAKVLLGAFVGYAMSHNFGWLMGGTTARFRLYSSWGLSAVEIVKLFAMLGLTFSTGFCALSSAVFLTAPLPLPEKLQQLFAQFHLPITSTFWLGPICLSVLAIYLGACALGRPISIRGWRAKLPPLRLALMQIVVGSVDLLLATGVMYVLLPAASEMSYWRFANVPLLALGAGVASHVPGGVGVIELVVIELVPHDDPATLMGTLLAFRAIFYLLPLVVAIGLLGGHEWFLHRQRSRSKHASKSTSDH